MGQDEVRDDKPDVNEGRRKLIKAAAVAGGAAVAVGALPGDWKKPLATVGGLPAHAQTSDAPITIPDNSLSIVTVPGDTRATNGDLFPLASFDYVDPLCDIDDTATLWAQVGPCGAVRFDNVRLRDVPASMSGGRCSGKVRFAFEPCGLGNGSLSVQLSKGRRQSNIVNASFFWEPDL